MGYGTVCYFGGFWHLNQIPLLVPFSPILIAGFPLFVKAVKEDIVRKTEKQDAKMHKSFWWVMSLKSVVMSSWCFSMGYVFRGRLASRRYNLPLIAGLSAHVCLPCQQPREKGSFQYQLFVWSGRIFSTMHHSCLLSEGLWDVLHFWWLVVRLFCFTAYQPFSGHLRRIKSFSLVWFYDISTIRLSNVKSIFIHINNSISNNSV